MLIIRRTDSFNTIRNTTTGTSEASTRAHVLHVHTYNTRFPPLPVTRLVRAIRYAIYLRLTARYPRLSFSHSVFVYNRRIYNKPYIS